MPKRIVVSDDYDKELRKFKRKMETIKQKDMTMIETTKQVAKILKKINKS